MFSLCLQEILKEPSQSREEEVESERRKPAGGQSADVCSGWDHHRCGQDERYTHYTARLINDNSVVCIVERSGMMGNVVLYWRKALTNSNHGGHWFAEEVHGLLKALVLFQFDKQAEKLQLAYEEALHMVEVAVPEVWPENLQNTQAPVNIIQSDF